ncbi:MAG: c-type cytochrome [Verrucomicrobiales bacterium]|nr:c-type cytochrome [Verrucomicrobiales bacterium]
MKSLFSLALSALGVSGLAFGTRAAEVRLNGHAFTVPDGFVVERVPGTEVVPRPVSASFDDRGALYVTDSAGLNLPPAEQLKDPKNRLFKLVDADGDGRYERSTVFAEGVVFPQGCLWHGNSVYVAGPPSIWKFTDADGDGVAEKREEWYQGKVLTGCANDVHGPYLGPEGMLYWTKGAFERLDLKDYRGRPIQDRCAHIFRARPDGSHMEVVMSGGMDNPVEVAFLPDGEPIVISTFIDLSQPGRRDGLAHAVYGGVFGKINGVLDEPMVKRTGDLMPTMTQYGPAAACALMRYQGTGLGAGYEDNLFGTLFNLRKVTRHVVRAQGASYATQDSDFLVSDQMDFHPTDILQDIDGSLLVVDTGGWYKLCCPSSQLAKADVLGAVYRVRRSEGGPGSSRIAAGERDIRYSRLVGPPTMDSRDPVVPLKTKALQADPSQAAVLRDSLVKKASAASADVEAARVVRVAAEGLGRMQDRASVPALVEAIAAVAGRDRFLEHSLVYALIEIGDATAVRSHLGSGSPFVRRAALLALEQIEGGGVPWAEVLPALRAEQPSLKEAAQWVAKRHPEWSGALTAHFRTRLVSEAVVASEKADWEGLLPFLLRSGEGRAFLAEAVAQPGFRNETRVASLRAMSGLGGKEMPAGWSAALVSALGASSGAVVDAALEAVRALPLPKEGDPAITAQLRRVATSATHGLGIRVKALATLPIGAPAGGPEWSVLREILTNPERAATERAGAALAVSRMRFSPEQLGELVSAVEAAGPLELPKLLAAYAPAGSVELGHHVLEALRESKALRALRSEEVRAIFAQYPDVIRQGIDGLLASMQSDTSKDRERLDALLVELKAIEGNVRRGQSVFNATKSACSTCHRLGYLGGDLGPDLTAIGTIRSERDLLEALLYPSVSLVRSYEPWIAVDRNGDEFSGVLRRDSPDEIVLAPGPGAEVRIARADLKELRPGQLSIMPAGLDEQLTRQELADLIAFLKNTKWGAN